MTTRNLEKRVNDFFGGKSQRKSRSAPKSDTWVIFPDGRAERIVWRREVRRYQTAHYSAASLRQIKSDMQTFEPGVRFEKRESRS